MWKILVVAARRGVLQYRINSGLGCISAEDTPTMNQEVAGRKVSPLTPSHLSLLARLEAQREHDARRRA